MLEAPSRSVEARRCHRAFELELHAAPEPKCSVTWIWTEEAAGLGTPSSDPEVVVGAGAA